MSLKFESTTVTVESLTVFYGGGDDGDGVQSGDGGGSEFCSAYEMGGIAQAPPVFGKRLVRFRLKKDTAHQQHVCFLASPQLIILRSLQNARVNSTDARCHTPHVIR